MDYTTEIINISKMREGFFIGDRIAGTNLDVVIQFKITHMINAAGSEIINQFESIGIKYLTLNWSENPKQNLFDSKDEISNRIVQFIDDSLKNGEGLLAHSVKGQNRVCIVVIIYLMKKYNWSLRKCIEFIQSKKQDVDIPKFFLEQLYNFGIRLDKNFKGKKKENWIDDDNYVDLEERLMRNTYVNGLPSDKNVKSDFRNKKKKKVGWADNNPFGKNDYLFTCNLKKDLFLMKDVKTITNHLRMKPGKSCVKNKSKSVPSGRDYNNNINIYNNNNYNNDIVGNGNLRNTSNNNSNRIYNIQQVKEEDIMKEEYNNNVNQFTFGLDSNILEQIGNLNSLTLPQNNNNINNDINEQNNNVIMSRSLQPNPTFNNSIKEQKIVKQNQQFINNPVNNRNIQNNNQIKQPKRINNFVKDNNNKQNYNFQPQKRSNTYDKNSNSNLNLKNFINTPEQNINDYDSNNIRNYSLVKEQENFPNNNNNNKVIFTHNYEQIVTNNINNYFIQNPDVINNNENNINKRNQIPENNIKIYNKDFNDPSISTNISSSTIKRQLNNYINNSTSSSQKINNNNYNQLRNSNSSTNSAKNNYQGKKPINYNNYFFNENFSENQSINKFKVIDYSPDSDPSNVMMRNLMNQPTKNIYNNNNNNNNNNINNNNNNNNQNRNQFLLGGINNYNPKKNNKNNNQNFLNKKSPNNNFNNNKPLNNYNPSLLRKAKTPLFTRQNNNSNRPVKIQKELIKKPTTPDQINRNIIRPGNMKINYNHYTSNTNNNYISINRANSKNKNEPIKRPSTAPQKEKNNNNNINRNNIKGKNNIMGQTMKRAPSPMIQSHNHLNNNNMNKTQKFYRPGYRAPSPMIKSSNPMNLDRFKNK